jgi:predicted nicotinamide N-methyase
MDAPPAAPRELRRLATLRRRAAARYPLRDVTLAIPGARRPYSIALPANPDDPLDHFAATTPLDPATATGERTDGRLAAQEAARMVSAGVHMPYWATLWASGQALAEALLAVEGSSSEVLGSPAPLRAGAGSDGPHPPAPSPTGAGEPDSSCQASETTFTFPVLSVAALELGCGLGVTATAALECGVSLLAADCFTEALLYCRYNTLRNTGGACRTLPLDWRTPAGRAACVARGPFALLLAADVLYEEEDILPLLELAPALLRPGARFWLAEPGRRVSRLFVAAAETRGWRDTPTVYERDWPELGAARVTVHRYQMG